MVTNEQQRVAAVFSQAVMNHLVPTLKDDMVHEERENRSFSREKLLDTRKGTKIKLTYLQN